MCAYIPSADDAAAFVESLVDPHKEGDGPVTHWHLTRTESSINAKDRYERERWRNIEAKPQATAWTPKEALHWLVDQQCRAVAAASDAEWVARRRGWHTEQDWKGQMLVTWDALTRRHGHWASSTTLAVRDGYAVEIYAHPQTGNCCPDTRTTD